MKIASFFVGLSVCVATTAIAAPFQSPSGYRISPPPGFVLRPNTSFSAKVTGTSVNNQAADAFFIGPHNASLIVITKVVPSVVTLPLLLRVLPAQLERMSAQNVKINSGPNLGNTSKIHIVSKGYTTLGGSKAIFFSSRVSAGARATPVLSRQVIALRGGKMFMFNFSALATEYPSRSAAFNRALSSVKWTK